MTMRELLSLPDDAPWRVLHTACDFDREGPGYWLEIETVRTHVDLLRQTARLHGKTWLDGTDWFAVIDRAAAS